MTTLLIQRLRTQAKTLRRKPTPLVDLIPLLTEAADAIEQAIAQEQTKQDRKCTTCRHEQQHSNLAPCRTCIDAYAYPGFADAHETEHNWEPKP